VNIALAHGKREALAALQVETERAKRLQAAAKKSLQLEEHCVRLNNELHEKNRIMLMAKQVRKKIKMRISSEKKQKKIPFSRWRF
jgi:cobalamin biosynthesis protein CbiD